jgi:hypothetical protein
MRYSADDVMITSAIPVIAVSNSARAEDYYCRVLGFQKIFNYRMRRSLTRTISASLGMAYGFIFSLTSPSALE